MSTICLYPKLRSCNFRIKTIARRITKAEFRVKRYHNKAAASAVAVLLFLPPLLFSVLSYSYLSHCLLPSHPFLLLLATNQCQKQCKFLCLAFYAAFRLFSFSTLAKNKLNFKWANKWVHKYTRTLTYTFTHILTHTSIHSTRRSSKTSVIKYLHKAASNKSQSYWRVELMATREYTNWRHVE